MSTRLFLVILNFVAVLPGASADEWPQWRGPQRDGVWRETGVVDAFAAPELKPLWRAPVGAGYSGPTVAGERVFVTDRVTAPEEQERVWCFDRA
ncbi:MAG TPA: PQQ-binding-like beta-propeller repeat protein, partial [Prosthecobacter sp.]|nr:PQQ-binding-like beta-propeller repeat protein [Prosthecobacter sp.]